MSKGYLSAIAGIAAAASTAGAAMAQDEPAVDGAYVRLGVGAAFVGDWEQDLAYNPTVAFVTPPAAGQTVDNGRAMTFAGALGFDYADGIRTELEYRYASTPVASVTPAGGVPTAPANEDVTAHFLMTNFFFDFANSSPLTPFIGGGVGGAFVSNEMKERDAALALQGRAGVSLAMGTVFTADLEYIYLRTNDLDFGPSADEFILGGPLGPAISGDRYQASSVMVSLRRRF